MCAKQGGTTVCHQKPDVGIAHTPVVEGELESLCDELSCLRALNQLKALEFPLCIDSMGVDDNVVSGALV